MAEKFKAEYYRRKEYGRWKSMIESVNDTTHPDYKSIGAKGISICERWTDKRYGYINFINDMGLCDHDKPVILRKDISKDFIPGNCKWTTADTGTLYTPENLIKKFNITNAQVIKYILENKIKYLKDIPGKNAWLQLTDMILNPSNPKFNIFRSPKIFIHDDWKGKFGNFINDMGVPPDDTYMIERIDKTRDFIPGNCIWTKGTFERNHNGYIKIYPINFKLISKYKREGSW